MSADSKQAKLSRKPKYILLTILIIAILALLSTGIYTVKESEEAVIQTFGRYSHTAGPGLHLKFPWPLQDATILPVQMTQKMELGYYQDASGYHSDQEDSMMITGDMSVVSIDFFLEWKISDPVTYLFSAEDPVDVLRNLLMSSVRSVVGTKTIDDTLTTGKFEIQNEVQEMLMEKLAANDIGVQILDVKVNDSEPPTEEVSRAFRDVETAKQEREMALNQATAYRNRKIPEAKAESDRILQEAEAYKTSRVAEAQGLYDRYSAVYEEYRKFPEISKQRMFLEILQDTLPNVKVVVDETGTVTKLMPLLDSANNALLPQNEDLQKPEQKEGGK